MAQPDLIPMPFAENATPGTIEPIPATTPTVPQDATWSTGFPQVTMQPLASGGIPPRGQNFNGVLNALSQHIFHMQGGGQYKWDDAHGPYSIGDVLQSDDGLRSYVSVINNNTNNFNTNPAAIGVSWLPWSGGAASELVAGLVKIATTAQAQAMTADDVTLTPKKLADAFSGANRLVTGDNRYQIFPGTDGTRRVIMNIKATLSVGSTLAPGQSANVNFDFPIAVKPGTYPGIVATPRNVGLVLGLNGAARWPGGDTIAARNITENSMGPGVISDIHIVVVGDI